jgi:preprotein translocase subunit SecG
MTIFLIVLHVVACTVLIILVLIQRGRGAGLVESFAGVESMFGTKTSAFLTRTTTIMSIVFFITCLSLAVLSVRQSKSLMEGTRAKPKTEALKPAAAKTEAAKAEAVATKAVEATPAAVAPVEAAKPDAAAKAQ